MSVFKNARDLTLGELVRRIDDSPSGLIASILEDFYAVFNDRSIDDQLLRDLTGGASYIILRHVMVESFLVMTFRKNFLDFVGTLPDDDKKVLRLNVVSQVNPKTGAHEDFMGDAWVAFRVDESTVIRVICVKVDSGYSVNVSIIVREDVGGTVFDAHSWLSELVSPNLYEGLVLNVTSKGILALELNTFDLENLSSYSVEVEERVAEFEKFLDINVQERLSNVGLPVRHAILMEGPPGSGKSTLIRRIASRTPDDVTVFVVEPDASLEGLESLSKYFAKTIVVFEDVDSHTGGRGSQKFTKFLNSVDGVGNDTGVRLFIASTNDSTRLDPAVLRPGRFDTTIVVGTVRLEALTSMFAPRFPDWSETQLKEFVGAVEGVVGAQKLTPALATSLSRKIIVNGYTCREAVEFVKNGWTPFLEGVDYTTCE